MIDRAKFQLHLVGQGITAEEVAFLGTDPGSGDRRSLVEEMLVQWFGAPEDDEPVEPAAEAPASEAGAESSPARSQPSLTSAIRCRGSATAGGIGLPATIRTTPSVGPDGRSLDLNRAGWAS